MALTISVKGRIWLALAGILCAGFLLRSYRLDFPSIGYHNMKENEMLSVAQEMRASGDYLTKRVYFINAFAPKPGIAVSPGIPLVPYQIIAAWNMLGENLWAPRLVNVVFGVASILVVFLAVDILLSNPLVALWAAAVMAVSPLTVFFSRNLQSESPALFFMLLAQLFYLRYARAQAIYNFIFGSIFTAASVLYNVHFLVGIVPALACLPYPTLWKNKKKRAVFGVAGCAFLLVPAAAWVVVSRRYLPGLQIAHPFAFFTPHYWRMYGGVLSWFMMGENFTWIFCMLAVCGIVLAFSRRNGLQDRYIIGWMAAALAYAVFYAQELTQNSFSQMPFAALVCISSAYTILFLSNELARWTKWNVTIALMSVLMALSAWPVHGSLTRMYNTFYIGADVAGETLRELTQPAERVFMFTHAQGYAVARYAQRYVGWPASLEDFKKKERDFNVRYVCIFPAQFISALQKNEPAVFDYLQDNYHLKEVGLVENLQQMGYLIFEKGKAPNSKNIMETLSSVQGSLQPRSIYKLGGRLVFFYSLRPEVK